MNKTLKQYIKTCDNDALYNLFDNIVEEMNKRKEKEAKDEPACSGNLMTEE